MSDGDSERGENSDETHELVDFEQESDGQDK
jgi:hypothetical protein